MFLVSDRLKIAVATGHISLAQVTEHITAPLLEKRLTQMERSLQEDFCLHSPRIAVLGLDPHNGDEGVIGTTDSQLIAPTIARLFDGGHYVFGPYSSDGFFGSGAYTRFDGVLAMYIANMREISYAEAMNEIAHAVDFYLSTLEKGDPVDIEGVGSIRPDGQGGLCFTQFGDKDFNRKQYGLSSTCIPQETPQRT